MSSRWALLPLPLVLSTACADEATLSLGAAPFQGPAPGSVADGVPSLRPLPPNGRVTIPAQSENEFLDHFTLEAWVFPHSVRGGSLFCKVGGAELKRLTLTDDGLLARAELAMGAPPSPVILESTQELRPLRWHHLALTYGRGVLQLFVDGTPSASTPRMDPVVDGPAPVSWGACEADGAAPADAAVSDLRFSRTGRYAEAFTPESNLVVDAAVSAMFHLREGKNGPALDEGPHDVEATIEGAVQWPLLPARP